MGDALLAGLVWLVAMGVLLASWRTEVADRNRNNREFAQIYKTNPSCVDYLQRVARTPTWRISLLACCVAAPVQMALAHPPHRWRSGLVGMLVVLITTQLTGAYYRWHIMCHAQCKM